MTPRSLINPQEHFGRDRVFLRTQRTVAGRRPDQSALDAHARGGASSALGPGGLNRKRAGFEVRDVHISHYGRICPIETPEGTNIGLISSLAIYSAVDEYGFLVTPYRKVNGGKLTEDVVWLRADEESEAFLAPADATVENGKLKGDTIIARYHAAGLRIGADRQGAITSMWAPSQMVGVSAGLIPFLEHDDANRALMGSTVQALEPCRYWWPSRRSWRPAWSATWPTTRA